MNNQAIKQFVQEVLGCGCPEEVFSRIEHEKGVSLGGGLILRDRIVVGRRLLVYLFEGAFEEGIEESAIRALLTAGVSDRNRNNFNRIRLVLLTKTDDGNGLSEVANRMVSEYDDRTFAHVIARDLVSF